MLLRSGRTTRPRRPAPLYPPRGVKQEVKKIKKKVSKLNKAMVAGIRSRQVISGTNALTQAGFVQLFNGMQVGDEDSKRDGNKIHMLNIDLAYDFSTLNTSMTQTQNATIARCMLIYDTQSNSAIYSNQDLLSTSGSAGINFTAVPNPDYKKRFKILYDRSHKLVPLPSTRVPVNVATSYEFAPSRFRVRKKLNKKVFYNDGNAGTYEDIVSGALWFVCYARNDAAWFEVRVVGNLYYNP